MLAAKTRWKMKPFDQEKIHSLVNEMKMTPFVASMLVNRGINTVEAARYFLFGENEFHDPFLFQGMDKAVARIQAAIQKQEAILIFGDYDADGVSSTTVLMRTLNDLGANVQFYIPNRFTEGYGPNEKAFREAAAKGIALLITVDTGIAAVHEAQVAKELGMDLIITDHHEPGPVLPDAFTLIHPKIPGSTYPFRDLAGVGVAFKLAHALYGRVPEHLLEIAVIGTIADLVPLKGENRLIAKRGLEKLKSTANLGLRAILKLAGANPKSIDEETVGFTLAPRINAVGRLEDADLAVHLLLTDDQDEAEALAHQMESLNKERQQLVAAMTEEAVEEVEKNFPAAQNRVLVVGKENWNAGVIGIVASKLVEKYYRPAIVLSIDREKGVAKGSARSIPGFDLFKNLSECRDLLPHFGGHPMAAGMTMNLADVSELRDRLNQQAMEHLTAEDLIPITMLDAEMELADIDLALIEEVNLLAPFGVENPKPKIIIKDTAISSIRKIGANQTHLKLTISENGANLDGVGFGLGALADQISPMAKISLMGQLAINEWNNIRKPQIFIQDLAVQDWQLFDYRGGMRMNSIFQSVPNEKRKWIVFQESLMEELKKKLLTDDEVLLIQSAEVAKDADLDGANAVIVDLPPARVFLSELFTGKKPARIYAWFYKENSDFFSTFPTRDHFKWFYGLLLKKGPIDLNRYGDMLAKKRGWSKETIFFMSQVFSELDFVTINNGFVTIKRQAQKRDLTDSQTYRKKQEQYAVESELLFSPYQQLKAWFDQAMQGSVKVEEAMEEWT
ncbi:single-stranded-DNA-specific exonuclease RecJ [Neobacillus sp. SM06]|uniref:single-stranded-DNA-specific exonuclease RecJ n=1 Tax=Neobacillus sp. SM06 TaxID=3422492 RepID=UPI003D2705F6